MKTSKRCWTKTGILNTYGFSSSTMKFYTLPSFSQHDQCEFLTLPSFVQHSQKFLFTIVIQHTWFLHNYMWVFNITLFCPAFPNSFCLFTTTWLVLNDTNWQSCSDKDYKQKVLFMSSCSSWCYFSCELYWWRHTKGKFEIFQLILMTLIRGSTYFKS